MYQHMRDMGMAQLIAQHYQRASVGSYVVEITFVSNVC